ncbi:hypothetical protein LINGRAHAP2_LOCUS36291 [Linum grandiflorum]
MPTHPPLLPLNPPFTLPHFPLGIRARALPLDPILLPEKEPTAAEAPSGREEEIGA